MGKAMVFDLFAWVTPIGLPLPRPGERYPASRRRRPFRLLDLDLKGRSALVNDGGLDLDDGLLVDGTRRRQMVSRSTTESPGESTAGRSRSRTWSNLTPARETVP